MSITDDLLANNGHDALAALELGDCELRLIAERARERTLAQHSSARRAQELVDLLENPAHYLSNLPYEADIGDEFGLMTAVTEYGSCGQLLDLHNLYCNALNHGFDAFAALDRIELGRVIEIHLAGGRREQGFWVDAHDSLVPAPVWRLLECALPRCPRIAGVVYELLDFFAPSLGAEAITDELRHIRRVWRRCCPAVRVAKV